MPDHFSVSEVASGVYACVAGASQAAVGNAAIVDTGAKTIVVDSFMTTVGAAELRQVAEQLTGRSVFMLVNTHWHGDHTRMATRCLRTSRSSRRSRRLAL